MKRFFFDFRAYGSLSRDEEGADLSDAGEAHDEALGALVDAMAGRADQRFAIEVRDEYGPVLEIKAVLESKILRKQ